MNDLIIFGAGGHTKSCIETNQGTSTHTCTCPKRVKMACHVSWVTVSRIEYSCSGSCHMHSLQMTALRDNLEGDDNYELLPSKYQIHISRAFPPKGM